MALLKKEVEVSKESDEMAQAVVALVKAFKDALADGWQMGTDLPVVLASAMAVLPAAVDGMDKLGEEKDEDMAAFLRAWSLAGTDLAALFLDKKPPVA